ncbi:hypothetical protein MAFF211271_30900 [Ralstonia syzygii subsp. indonesiensis]|nr:hypothetical protein MAFF211271_30900 [Ralstonia pseudosolanacearum]
MAVVEKETVHVAAHAGDDSIIWQAPSTSIACMLRRVPARMCMPRWPSIDNPASKRQPARIVGISLRIFSLVPLVMADVFLVGVSGKSARIAVGLPVMRGRRGKDNAVGKC